MPTYVYRCKLCGFQGDAFRKMVDRDQAPRCLSKGPCLGETERRITATMVSVFSPYRAVAVDKETGERPQINSRAEHEAFLRRNGYEEVGNDKSMAPPSREQFMAERARKLKEQVEPATFDFDESTHHAQMEMPA